jgi:hypothetical protein
MPSQYQAQLAQMQLRVVMLQEQVSQAKTPAQGVK